MKADLASGADTTAAAGDPSVGGPDPLARASIALLINSCATAALGILFWLAAAHEYNTAALGASAALISLMLLLANIAELNLTSVLVRFLPTAGTRRHILLLRSYATAAVLGFVVGLVAVVVAGSHVTLLKHIAGHGPLGAITFALAVSAWCIFALQDGAAIALRGASWIPIENGLFGIAKLALLVVLAPISERYGLLVAWIAPMVVILIPMNILIFWRLIPAERARSTRVEEIRKRQLGRFIGFEYASSLLSTATVTVVPILIAASTSDTIGGHFYLVWLIAVSLAGALNAVGSVVVVEGSRKPDHLAAIVHRLARRGAMFGLPLLAVGVIAAPLVLDVVGRSYAADGVGLLRLILVAVVPEAVIVAWMSAQRVHQNTGRILLVQGLLTAAIIGSTAVIMGLHGSLTMIGVAFLASQTLGAALVSADLLRVVRPRATTEPAVTA